ncbi:hypothetical protein B0T26DRAFT_670832 [Lasiosphaeria miniovina]|uniref:Uncharacterized protein n=1 Tax=Lasiosphaeria miniovina TaxID=1954250 RepID=A0AA40BHZ0_9PEZI|nr:uncharacterized protein B0T26DRAFT_670832 [Lasiosphaeria miniovina]KAK0734545.1 hypothetical protein B0T26DRAFT_670832 [Lasiosphaeria miniovina]
MGNTRLLRADIPVLEGEKNLTQWDSALWGYLNIYDFITLFSTKLKSLPFMSVTAQRIDPKVTYDLIKHVIPRLTQEAVIDSVIEFVKIDRPSFTTIQTFLTRLRFLYKKIDNLKAGVTEEFHLNLLITKLKKTYPDRHLFWLNGLKEKTLTWNKLNQELEEIAASEETSSRFAKLPSGSETKAKETKKEEGKGRKACGYHSNKSTGREEEA